MRRPLCLRTLKDLARVDGKGWGSRLLSILVAVLYSQGEKIMITSLSQLALFELGF